MHTNIPNFSGALVLIAAVTFASLGVACVRNPEQDGGGGKPRSGKLRIGFSMDTLKEERWQRDRDLFVARA